jgi:hypothetical protein
MVLQKTNHLLAILSNWQSIKAVRSQNAVQNGCCLLTILN